VLFIRAGERGNILPTIRIPPFSSPTPAAGYCTISDANGDQAYLSWKCGGDRLNCTGPFEYIGGTGKYSGISGSNNNFSATTEVNWQDGTADGLCDLEPLKIANSKPKKTIGFDRSYNLKT
jgi:hypothetical protein